MPLVYSAEPQELSMLHVWQLLHVAFCVWGRGGAWQHAGQPENLSQNPWLRANALNKLELVAPLFTCLLQTDNAHSVYLYTPVFAHTLYPCAHPMAPLNRHADLCRHESKQYDAAIDAYQEAEFQSISSINILNVVQSAIMFGGIASGLLVCAGETRTSPADGDRAIGNKVAKQYIKLLM